MSATFFECPVVYLLRVDKVREDGAKRPDDAHTERNRAQDRCDPVSVGCRRCEDP